MKTSIYPLNIAISISCPRFLNLKLFWSLSFILVIALLVFYIFQINFLAYQFHSFQITEEKLKNLEIENETLKINFSKSSSLANIENYFSVQDFEKTNPGQIKYIKILESEIVSK